MRHKIKTILLIGVLLGAGGCATPAQRLAMTVPSGTTSALSVQSPFHQSVSIGTISGGEETNPLWISEVGQPEFTDALRSSLANNALLADGTAPRFLLHANLASVDQPVFGLDMSVTSSIAYQLLDAKNKVPWYDELITATFTATFTDSPLGFERLRLANEGSIRKNIRTFMEDLVQRKGPIDLSKYKPKQQ
jgi:hypothetical protein